MMDNQEAIKIIGQYDVSDLHFYTTDGEEIPFAEWSDAIETAISALQVQDSKTRKICKTCKHDPPSKKWPCVDCDMREPADRWEKQDVPDTNVGDMKTQLPAKAQQNLQPACNKLATDTISRQSAIDECNKRGAEHIGYAIAHLPSAQPENIRCYECKHGIHSGCGDVYICNVSPELVMEHTGDFYCGYAERRTDD